MLCQQKLEARRCAEGRVNRIKNNLMRLLYMIMWRTHWQPFPIETSVRECTGPVNPLKHQLFRRPEIFNLSLSPFVSFVYEFFFLVIICHQLICKWTVKELMCRKLSTGRNSKERFIHYFLDEKVTRATVRAPHNLPELTNA